MTIHTSFSNGAGSQVEISTPSCGRRRLAMALGRFYAVRSDALLQDVVIGGRRHTVFELRGSLSEPRLTDAASGVADRARS